MVFLEARENANFTLNEGKENPDEDIEAFLFGDSNKESPDEDSLDDEWDHDFFFAHSFLQKRAINPTWILLNTGSSIYIFSNPQLLTNIHKSVLSTKIHCNTGVVRVTHIRTLPGFGLVSVCRSGLQDPQAYSL